MTEEPHTSDRIVGTIDKNRKERVQVSLSEYRGFDMLTVRIWYMDDDQSWKPGKQGLALRLELLPKLVALLQQAQAVAEGDHLLPSSSMPTKPPAGTDVKRVATELGATVFGRTKRKDEKK